MNVIPDRDTIISEIHIAAEPERIFQALIDPLQVVQWWGQPGIYRCTEFSADLRVGGKWSSSGVGPDGGNFKIKGEYLEIERPHLLVHTWVASWTGQVQTVVRWELSPTTQGTLLRLQHSGFAAHPEIANSYKGWPRMLGWIQAFLEGHETIDTRKAS